MTLVWSEPAEQRWAVDKDQPSAQDFQMSGSLAGTHACAKELAKTSSQKNKIENNKTTQNPDYFKESYSLVA